MNAFSSLPFLASEALMIIQEFLHLSIEQIHKTLLCQIFWAAAFNVQPRLRFPSRVCSLQLANDFGGIEPRVFCYHPGNHLHQILSCRSILHPLLSRWKS